MDREEYIVVAAHTSLGYILLSITFDINISSKFLLPSKTNNIKLKHCKMNNDNEGLIIKISLYIDIVIKILFKNGVTDFWNNQLTIQENHFYIPEFDNIEMYI